jgi:hypothetical protein
MIKMEEPTIFEYVVCEEIMELEYGKNVTDQLDSIQKPLRSCIIATFGEKENSYDKVDIPTYYYGEESKTEYELVAVVNWKGTNIYEPNIRKYFTWSEGEYGWATVRFMTMTSIDEFPDDLDPLILVYETQYFEK